MRANFALVCVVAVAACGCSSSSSKAATAPTTRPTSTSTSPSSVKARATGAPTSTSNPPDASSSTPTTVKASPEPPTVPPTPPTTPTTVVAADDAARAEQLVRSRGYVPGDTADFATPSPSGLHVIVATAKGSADGYAQRAFFFRNGDFLGTDLKKPSASVKIAWRNDTTIALSYAAYKTGEPLCCPTGGAMIVRYKLVGNLLKPLDPIPPESIRR